MLYFSSTSWKKPNLALYLKQWRILLFTCSHFVYVFHFVTWTHILAEGFYKVVWTHISVPFQTQTGQASWIFIPWSNKADGQRIKREVSDLHLSSYVSLVMMPVVPLGCKGTLLLPSLPSSPTPSRSLVGILLPWTLFLRSSSAAQRNSDLLSLSAMLIFRAGISPAPVAYCLVWVNKTLPPESPFQ